MAAARSVFLGKGYYAPLREALCALAVSMTGEAPTVLDAGCGEGYYTGSIYRALQDAGKAPQMAGTDISKFILRRAAKREKDIEFAVASSYRLPMAAGSADLIINCFSPMAAEEFRRVLRSGGGLLYVVPSEKHLWELKEILYHRPYINEVKQVPYEGFDSMEVRHVEKVIHMPLPGGYLGSVSNDALFLEHPPGWYPAPGGADTAGLPYQLRHSYFPQKRKELGETGCIYEKFMLLYIRCAV